MVRWGILALTIGSIVAAAGYASADTHTLSQSGSWEAFGGTTTNGRGVCGVSAEVAKRYFGVKFFAGNDTFTIQLGTGAWKAENGEKVELTMQLDANPVWRATGTVFHFEDGDPGLQYSIRKEELDNFVREFRTSSLLNLHFANGRFPPWTMGLQGTMAVYGAFQNCVRELK